MLLRARLKISRLGVTNRNSSSYREPQAGIVQVKHQPQEQAFDQQLAADFSRKAVPLLWNATRSVHQANEVEASVARCLRTPPSGA
jgi:hypothetical protein